MKLDKETLARNRFWVLLGVLVPLVLIALIYLSTGVAGELDGQRNTIKTHNDELDKGPAKAKGNNDSELRLLESKETRLKERKAELWKEAWALQKGLQIWPKAIEEVAAQEKYGGKPIGDYSFGDELKSELRSLYAQNKVYAGDKEGEYDELARTFREDLGKLNKVFEPVVFKDGWKSVINHVREWKTLPPSSEEVWLAQEDYWVQPELLLALRAANKSVARFKKVKPGPGIDANDRLQGSFENPYWRLDLMIVTKGQGFALKCRISNPEKGEDGLPRPKRVQSIGQIYFWLYLDKDPTSKPVPVSVQGDRLAPGEKREIETPLLIDLKPEELFAVEQVLEPRTAAIKRIDHLMLRGQSHRTYQPMLRQPIPRPGSAFAVVKPLPVIVPKGGPGPGGPNVGRGESVTENGLMLQRYNNVTNEVRRMPVGIDLVVDQAHVPEVEAFLASSPLRFQITQVTWQHFRGTLGSTDKEDGPKGGPKGESHGDEQASNLVELTIYGIASLYERPSDKKAETPAKERPKGDKLPKVDPKKDKDK